MHLPAVHRSWRRRGVGRNKGLNGIAIGWMVALFTVASIEAAWFFHVLDLFAWPLIDRMNAMPLSSWFSGPLLAALALLGLHGVGFLAWTIAATMAGDELRRRLTTGAAPPSGDATASAA